MRISGRVREKTVIAAIVLIACGLSATPAAARATFCDYGLARDYEKPVKRMPGVRKAPVGGHLPFGPARVFVGRIGRGPLLVGKQHTGFSLSFSPYRQGTRFSRRLNWLVEGRLFRVDHRGRAQKPLGKRMTKVKRLRSSDSSPSARLDLSFFADRPGLYRADMTIYTWTGRRLVRYGEYVRVLRPSFDARLALDQTSFKPGTRVVPRLENYGAAFLFFGLIGAYYERYDGTSWSNAGFGTGVVPAIGLGIGPGASAECWGRQIPNDASPGRYRFSLRIDHGRHPFSNRAKKTLHTEFDITG